VWARLGSDLKPRHLDKIVNGEIGLEEIEGCVQDWIDGKVTGRKLVKV
jgi:NADPH2:quinone reductase